MDFSFSSDQDELRSLTRRILDDTCTSEQLKAVSETDSGLDLTLWKQLADAGLVGIGLPESAGGGGLGFLETCIVLEEIARAAAPLPALAVMALAGPALATEPDLLSGVASGDVIVTAALHEPTGDVHTPGTSVSDGRITGVKVCVPAGLVADRFVVSTNLGLYCVEAGAPGVVRERQDTTTGIPEAMITFTEAPGRKIGDGEALEALVRHGTAGASVMTSGACAAALHLTAEYAKTRHQFERPIASFQAVSQRVADAYIDAEGVRLTAWQAAWRLAEGLPCDEQLLSAKFWAAEGGQRVVHAAHHVHGGVGVDRDYPLHRYFLLVKQLELQLGSATPSLLRLGRILADTPA
jgi:3-oxocholest-4-en-26-oyl-CoA dehydrogenase beta subunit